MRPGRSTDPVWRNWSGSVTADPVRVECPRSVADVVAAVQRPGPAGRDDRSGRGRPEDPARHVTLRAGTPLHVIPALLDPLGLAMTNLGESSRSARWAWSPS